MKLKTKYIQIIGLLVSICVFQSRAQSLDDYLKQAAENNPGVKAAYLEFEAAMQRLPQVSSLPDPTLSMSALGQMTRVGTQEARFSLMQTFPWWGTLKLKKEVAALEAEAKFQAYLDRRNELFFKVKRIYFELFEAGHHIYHKKENAEILENLRVLALSKFENGTTPMSDVIRIDIMQNDNDTDLKILQSSVKPLEIRFNRLLNQPDSLSVVIPDTVLLDFEKPIFLSTQDLSGNPQVQQWDRKMLAAGAQKKVAVKNGLPNIGIGIDYSIISERSDPDFSDNGQDAIMPVVSLSIPVFRKKYKAAQQEAELLQKAYSEMKTETENQLMGRWQNLLFEMEKAQQEMELYRQQEIKTRQTIQLVLSAYQNNNADIEEVLSLQQQLIKYKMRFTTSFANYLVAKSEGEYILGNNE